jgi:large subunit ribosomal protein L5
MTDTTVAPAEKVQPRLKQKYRSEILPALQQEFGFSNVHQVPGLVKVSARPLATARSSTAPWPT